MVKKNILVLGSTGFVGSNVVSELKLRYNVFEASLTKGVDIKDFNSFYSFTKRINPDIIINCSAHVGSLNYVTENAAAVISDNTEMINNIYKSVSKINKNIVIINPIANCAYPGAVKELYEEDDFYNGEIHESVFAYGSTRSLLLAYSKAFKAQHKINSYNLLVPNMYGPNDSTDPNKAHALNALVSKFVKAEYNNEKKVFIWGSGNVIREWLYAKDFAKLLLQIIDDEKSIIKNPINIAQEDGLTIKKLAEIINKNFNDKFELSYDLSKPDGAFKKVMSKGYFEKEFSDFSFTDFDKGISETILYYKSKLPY